MEEEDNRWASWAPCSGPYSCLSERGFLPSAAHHCSSGGALGLAPRFLNTSASQVSQLCFPPSLSLSKRSVESKRSEVLCHLFLLGLHASVSLPVNWRLKMDLATGFFPSLECFILVLMTTQFITLYYS